MLLFWGNIPKTFMHAVRYCNSLQYIVFKGFREKKLLKYAYCLFMNIANSFDL